MSHFLAGAKQHQVEHISQRPYACVKVELVRKGREDVLRVMPEILLLKCGSYLRKLPDRVAVQGPDGEVLAASGEFFVTSETIDPFHLLVDALDGNKPWWVVERGR